MTYNWTNPDQPFQQLYPVLADLHTACLPSIFDHEASLLRFLCEYTTEDALWQIFANSLSKYIQQANLEVVVFKAANQTWTVKVLADGTLDALQFSNFSTGLLLQPFDFILTGVCFDDTVRVIVFRSNDGSEKTAPDWEFDQV